MSTAETPKVAVTDLRPRDVIVHAATGRAVTIVSVLRVEDPDMVVLDYFDPGHPDGPRADSVETEADDKVTRVAERPKHEAVCNAYQSALDNLNMALLDDDEPFQLDDAQVMADAFGPDVCTCGILSAAPGLDYDEPRTRARSVCNVYLAAHNKHEPRYVGTIVREGRGPWTIQQDYDGGIVPGEFPVSNGSTGWHAAARALVRVWRDAMVKDTARMEARAS